MKYIINAFLFLSMPFSEAEQKSQLEAALEAAKSSPSYIEPPSIREYRKNIELKVEGRIEGDVIVVSFIGKGDVPLLVLGAYSTQGKKALVIEEENQTLRIDLDPLDESGPEGFMLYPNSNNVYNKSINYPLPNKFKKFPGSILVECMVCPFEIGEIFQAIKIN